VTWPDAGGLIPHIFRKLRLRAASGGIWLRTGRLAAGSVLPGQSAFGLATDGCPPAGFEPALTVPEAGPVHDCYLAKLALASPLGSVWGVGGGRWGWCRGSLVFPVPASMARAVGRLAGAY
jgi:hypothetical protein